MSAHDSDRGLLSDQELVAEESTRVLPMSVHKCPNGRKASVTLGTEKRHGDEDQSQISPHLKRSDSFVLAVSDSDVFSAKSSLGGCEESVPSAAWSPQSNNIVGQQNRECQDHDRPGRKGSSTSFVSGSSDEPLCRICHEGEEIEELKSPCYCSGSVGLLHLSCLERWLGASHSTRCELCKYEFTLKRLPRPLTEFMQDPPTPNHRRNLVCDLTCFALLTPITAASAYMCTSGALHYYQKQPNSWQMQGLIALTVCLITVYIVWLIIGVHHHYAICKKWREEHQVVKITFISPIRSKRTLRSSSLASCRLDAPFSPASSIRGSITAQESISDRGSQHRPSLVAAPTLRPILKYSTQFHASSWHSGLSDSAAELRYPSQCVPERSSFALLQSPQSRQETYV